MFDVLKDSVQAEQLDSRWSTINQLWIVAGAAIAA
jgi:hypothetical protein